MVEYDRSPPDSSFTLVDCVDSSMLSFCTTSDSVRS